MLCSVIQSCLTLCDPMNCSPPSSFVHGDSSGKNTGVVPGPPPGDLPNPGIKPRSPALQTDSLASEPIRKPTKNFSSVQFSCSVMSDSVTPWAAAGQAFLSITNPWNLLKLMSIESVMPCNHLILCHPLLLPPSIFPSIRVFSNESVFHIRWPKYWSFSLNISPSKEHPGLISFRMNWLDLLAVQGTLKSLLRHHSSKASILPCSAFFIVQLSHPYMTTGKTIALHRLNAGVQLQQPGNQPEEMNGAGKK